MPEVNTPDKTFTIKVDGADRTFTMYYGLLNELLTLVRDLNQVSAFFTEPEVRNASLTSLLSERDSKGKKIKEVGPEEVNVDFEDLENLLAWATAHVTAFFIRNLIKLTKNMQALPNDLQSKSNEIEQVEATSLTSLPVSSES